MSEATHDYWMHRRVLVTGGAGFLGRHVCDALARAGASHVTVPRSRDTDLRDEATVQRVYETCRPHVVLHLAATVGGIEANRRHPGRFFYDNALLGLHLIEGARRFEVERFVCVGTICSYPKTPPVPFREDDLWNGYPEETNAPYGLAKRMALVQLQAYRAEYAMRSAFLIPTNLYGPGDHDDLERSHVIPALIRKFVHATENRIHTVTLWGTGAASRDFLYVTDAAEAIVHAAASCDDPEPINLGTGVEVPIRDLAERIATLVGYRGAIHWDTSKPDGQPRRIVDSSRAARLLGWQARVPFNEGLARTVAAYREARARADD